MRDAQVLNFVRGSSALLGAVDIGIALLAVKRHPNWRRIVMLGRFGSDEIVAELTENGYQLVDADGQHSGETGIAQAVSFLKAALSNGPVRATEIIAQAKEAGISERTLHRAKATLGVKSEPGQDGWYWQPP